MFNLFVNDLLLYLNKTDPHKVADDNTISAARRIIKKLTNILEEESRLAIDQFKEGNVCKSK